MNELRDIVGTAWFLRTITLPLTLVSICIALMIAAFAPPKVSKTARVYYQSSVALIAFRVWYASTYEPGKIAWWGNLFWLNLMIASVILAGAVVLASSRRRATDRRIANEHA